MDLTPTARLFSECLNLLNHLDSQKVALISLNIVGLLKADLYVVVKMTSFCGTEQQASQGFRDKLRWVLSSWFHILTQEKEILESAEGSKVTLRCKAKSQRHNHPPQTHQG